MLAVCMLTFMHSSVAYGRIERLCQAACQKPGGPRCAIIASMLREILSEPRLVRYLVLNVVLSALTALIVLSLWTHFVLAAPPTALAGTPLAAGSFSGQLRVAAVVGAGDLENEVVTIEHVGDVDVTLAGWRLRDSGGAEFRFPALVLHSGAQVSIFTRSGDDSASQLFWDRQVPVWSSGEHLSLLDPSGQLQATYTVP